jgi:cation transporter-like permease
MKAQPAALGLVTLSVPACADPVDCNPPLSTTSSDLFEIR